MSIFVTGVMTVGIARMLEHLPVRLSWEGLDAWKVDSTAGRVAPASSSSVEKEAEELLDHALDRSRCGLVARIHLVCDAKAAALRLILSPGQANGISYAQPLLDQVRIPGRPGRSSKRSRCFRLIKSGALTLAALLQPLSNVAGDLDAPHDTQTPAKFEPTL